jgi:hypothetical protein
MPQYMLVLHADPSGFARLSPEQMQASVEKYMLWGKKLRDAGYLTASNKLTDEPGRVIRSSDGQLRVTDGPYSETKEALASSPVTALNRIVALSKVEGPLVALAEIAELDREPILADYYLLPAVKAELLSGLGDHNAAAESYRAALARPCNEPERRFLMRRLAESETRN